MEFKDIPAKPARCLGMGYHHQDNGNTFADRYRGVAIHGLKHKGEQMAKPSLEFMPGVLAFLQVFC